MDAGRRALAEGTRPSIGCVCLGPNRLLATWASAGVSYWVCGAGTMSPEARVPRMVSPRTLDLLAPDLPSTPSHVSPEIPQGEAQHFELSGPPTTPHQSPPGGSPPARPCQRPLSGLPLALTKRLQRPGACRGAPAVLPPGKTRAFDWCSQRRPAGAGTCRVPRRASGSPPRPGNGGSRRSLSRKRWR